MSTNTTAPVMREVHTPFRPNVREAAEGEAPSRRIEGYAIVFGEESVLIVDWWDAYREVIEPGAVTTEDLKEWDIKMTLWHNRERLLARRRYDEGTLTLDVDEKGLKYSFEAPNTPDGDTALELVRRGDISGASFTFYLDERNARYEDREDGTIIRYVEKISRITECTLASDPAYLQTTATAEREAPEAVRQLAAFQAAKPKTIDEKQLRENESAVAAYRAAAAWK